MNNEEEKLEGTMVFKFPFETLKIDVKEEFSKYISVEGETRYDFNFKNLEEAEQFFVTVVKQALEQGTFDMQAATFIANDLLIHFK